MASGDSFPLDGKFLWRVRRGICEGTTATSVFCGIARPKNFLAHLEPPELSPWPSFLPRSHPTPERDVQNFEVRQKSEAEVRHYGERRYQPGGYMLLEPLAVVPVKMELLDAANAVVPSCASLRSEDGGHEKSFPMSKNSKETDRL